MNFSTLAPFIASIIRHALVAGGLIELSRADDTSKQLASSICTLSGIAWSLYNAHKSKKQSGTTKISGDWKFWMQLSVLMIAIGGGIQANFAMQQEVQELRRMDKIKTETILRMEGKFDLLNLQIQQLKERLEAKKIVHTVGFDAGNLSGESYIEDK